MKSKVAAVFMLNVIILSVSMLIVIMLSVIILSIIILSIVMLNVVMLWTLSVVMVSIVVSQGYLRCVNSNYCSVATPSRTHLNVVIPNIIRLSVMAPAFYLKHTY